MKTTLSPEEKKKIQRLRVAEWRKNNKERNKENSQKWYQNNKEKSLEKGKEWRENNVDKIKENRKENKEKTKEYGKQYREKNREREQNKTKNWRNNNRDKLNKNQQRYRKSIQHIVAWRNILKGHLGRIGKKKENNTIELLCYSPLELKVYIQSLFTEGMSWDNYGEWHVDHIKRVKDFDKETHPSIVNALTNLRPLWATSRIINGVFYEGNLNRG
jgi:hypothetical protein